MKFILFITFIFLSQQAFPSCHKDTEVNQDHLEQVRDVFLKGMTEKHIQQIDIRFYTHPTVQTTKLVYVEYNKVLWGSLYVIIFGEDEILRWDKVKSYGNTTECARWEGINSFYFVDSTSYGKKTSNLCYVIKKGVFCDRLAKY